MKTINQFKRKPLARWIAMSLVSASVIGGTAMAAAPLAGTEIKNLATVSYEDENGNTYTAQSNEAVITVAPQFRATLENDRAQSAAPGQTVYFPHTLTNTGNTPDTYTLTTDTSDDVYLDTNGNGQPDAGEQVVTTVTVQPGETVNLLVAHQVPTTAADGSTIPVVLTTTSASNGAIVKDIGDNTDGDSDDSAATNNDVINVTTGPVLVLNKQAVFDASSNKVTYTLTVKNTGGSDAKLVDIIDAVPTVDHDDDAATGNLPLTNVTIVSVNGLLDTGDTVPSAVTLVDETVIGEDLDGDGAVSNTSLSVIKAVDATLAPNTTVSVVYSADYDPAWRAGSSVDNTFITQSDNDNDPSTPKTTVTSNTTHNEIPQTYSVDADDDGVNSPTPGVNDGNDDGNPDVDDEQLVDKIAAGDTVIFTHVITNEGNGNDILNLDVANTDFPAGTLFTLWNANGTVSLTDSDSDGIPDSGVLEQNESATIVVKATLPSGVSGIQAGGYNAVLTATSSEDSNASNSTGLKLGEITPPAVDLAAVTADNATGTVATNHADQASDGFNDGGAGNAHDEDPVLFANDAALGSTVSFPMSVANESGSADSYLLDYADLPAGWSVVFKNESGTTITATPFLPPGKTFNYTAFVTVSNDPTQAEGDSPRATDVDGYDAVDGGTTLTGTDGDKDYVIEFNVTSAADSTRKDSIKHAVDVKATPAMSITPDGQNQIQPGGTVEYPHKLVNDGNIDEAVELVATNSDPSWSSTTLIDTNGDGVGDTELANLTENTVIKVYNPDGSIADATLTDTDNDGIVEFPLEPGQYVKLTNKVFAPADASQGAVNATQLTAQDPGPTATVRNTATDTSNVILGQVRLDKTVALQTDCTDPASIGPFAALQSSKVEPGQCVVWQIIAKNEGDALVKNVVVNDTVPTYTAALADSLKYCKGFGCVPATVTDATQDDEGEMDNSVVTFFVGDSSNPAIKLGGELLSGESATVRFTVKVDE